MAEAEKGAGDLVSSEEADENLEPEQHQSSAGGATTSYPTLKASACEAEKGG